MDPAFSGRKNPRRRSDRRRGGEKQTSFDFSEGGRSRASQGGEPAAPRVDTSRRPQDPNPQPISGADRLGILVDSIEDRFLKFHAANPAVYAHFVAEARLDLQQQQAANQRRVDEGGKLIKPRLVAKKYFEKLRGNPALETEGEPFKLNNDFTACYARLANNQEADLRGYFEFRKRKSS